MVLSQFLSDGGFRKTYCQISLAGGQAQGRVEVTELAEFAIVSVLGVKRSGIGVSLCQRGRAAREGIWRKHPFSKRSTRASGRG